MCLPLITYTLLEVLMFDHQGGLCLMAREHVMYNLYQLTPVKQIYNVKTEEWCNVNGESVYQWVEDSKIEKFMDWFDENYSGELRKIMRVSRGQMQEVIDVCDLESNL